MLAWRAASSVAAAAPSSRNGKSGLAGTLNHPDMAELIGERPLPVLR